jgi:type II secretory pathway pseudopilin PulG
VEIIVVIAILGILAAVAVPRFIGFTSMAKESVCSTNQKTVERMYSNFLVENDIDHTDSIFNQFLVEKFDVICPAGGLVIYEDGSEGDEDEPPGDEVPWL